jgi:hypothetical protein
MTMGAAPNWLRFVATFEDGEQIIQNTDDCSERTEGKNCFYEVQEKQKESPLISFVLAEMPENSEDAGVTFGVSMEDGHFEVKGIPFHHTDLEGLHLTNRRIIYLRNNTIYNLSNGESVYQVGYTLGWQANDADGKNVQREIKII